MDSNHQEGESKSPASADTARDMAQAIEQLYKTRKQAILSQALRLTKNRERAEALFHDAIVKALSSHALYPQVKNLENWVRGIMVNLFITQYRRIGLGRSVILRYPQQDRYLSGGYAEEMHENRELWIAVERAVSQLPPRSAEAIRLRFFEGYSYKELEIRMGLSSGGVCSTVHAARRRLFALLPQKFKADLGQRLQRLSSKKAQALFEG